MNQMNYFYGNFRRVACKVASKDASKVACNACNASNEERISREARGTKNYCF